MKEVLAFLRSCGVFYVATTDGEQPRVRPFGAAAEFEGKLYLITGNGKQVFRQLQKNARLEISGMTPDGQWLRLTARAVFDPRVEAKREMLRQNPDLNRMYREDDGVMEVFFLEDARAEFCSFTAPPRVVSF